MMDHMNTTCETINCNIAQGQPCRGCAGMPFQCNHCRANHPNARTVTRAKIVADVAKGATVEQAEARHGVSGGVVI